MFNSSMASKRELPNWEQRVHEQLARVERLEGLKRFFSPQLAEMILAAVLTTLLKPIAER